MKGAEERSLTVDDVGTEAELVVVKNMGRLDQMAHICRLVVAL